MMAANTLRCDDVMTGQAHDAHSWSDVRDGAIFAYFCPGIGVEPPAARDYPRTSGDVTVLGPQVIASTSSPERGTVIAWQGVQFTYACGLDRDVT